MQPTPEKSRALFERSEFARRRSRRTAQGTRRATPRPTWFWVLLPKQKDLATRGETRQHRKPRRNEISSHQCNALSSQHVRTIVIPIHFQRLLYLCALLGAAVTPAGWPKGGTLSSPGGPCSSPASWSALRKLASRPSFEVRRGVTGFGYFCRNKSGSPAGAKPGNTKKRMNTRVRNISAMRSHHRLFLLW